jgi:hypothetical protein
MKISETHQRYADNLDNQRALSNPEEFLGPNWKDVLNFWLYFDTLSPVQFGTSEEIFLNLDFAVRRSAPRLAQDAAYPVACFSNIRGAFAAAAGASEGSLLSYWVRGWATYELIGSHKILEQGNPLTFVPPFLDL